MHHEFVPEKQTVNGKFYKEVLKRLMVLVHSVSEESASWYFLHYNVPINPLGIVYEF
jgi:hypothetical protein